MSDTPKVGRPLDPKGRHGRVTVTLSPPALARLDTCANRDPIGDRHVTRSRTVADLATQGLASYQTRVRLYTHCEQHGYDSADVLDTALAEYLTRAGVGP